MKEKRLLFVLLLIAFGIGLFSFVSAEETKGSDLEIEYPQILGTEPPETTDTSLFNYIEYIYNLIIIVSGVIALGALIIASIRYLTSAGKPEKLSDARKQILAAFVGIILLLGSYIILVTINPEAFSSLKETPSLPFLEPGEPVPPENYAYLKREDMLIRVKGLAESIKSLPGPMTDTLNEIESLTGNCDCQNTEPICLCTGGAAGDACQPRSCFAGPSSHPCPESGEIRSLQKETTDLRNLFLYSRTRALSEKEDLKRDIENFLDYEISWYNEQITAAEDPSSAGGEIILNQFKEKKRWLEEEKNYKELLIKKLEELASAIKEIESPSSKIPQLSGQCFSNVQTKCTPTCKTGQTYGCHDRLDGCQPDKCTGGNPCPMAEIQREISAITPVTKKITAICKQIIAIVDNIEKEEIIEINS